MGINRIELQGQIVRTQDYQAVKHQEDSRTSVEQTSVQSQMQKQESVRLNRVQTSENTTGQNMGRHDASEKGKNEYAGDGGKNRNKKKEEDGKVLLKGVRTRKVITEEDERN